MNMPFKDNLIIEQALQILECRLRKKTYSVAEADDARSFLTLKLAEKESERFCAMFLDNRHQLIEFVELFTGTVDGASVYPREVVKTALSYNAAAVILAHNHPSGNIEPSHADKALTNKLNDALNLVEIRLIDHFLVAGKEAISFAEVGWL